jgi:homospermidine synthase
MKFTNKILVVGCGAVSCCTVPLLLKHIDIFPENITVIDMEDKSSSIKDAVAKGVRFRKEKITKENLNNVLSGYVSDGDIMIDLSCNIDSIEMIEWCHTKNVLYINASVESWDNFEDQRKIPVAERTLYARQMEIRKLTSGWGKGSATAVLDHGANPGLVSHFTKLGLLDIAEEIINKNSGSERVDNIKKAAAEKDFARLAQLEGVKVIHISERDTQITDKPKEVNEFVNTWSVVGFYEEGIAPSEMGWGTHERKLPEYANFFNYGPGNQICLSKTGFKTWVRSCVPSGEITGMVIRHGEAFTISDHLTVWDDGRPIYRPTVNYAYCPTDCAVNSIHELEMRQFKLQEKQRIMFDEIISGSDELGVLIMGHDCNSWWVGSTLSIGEARKLVPHQNATTLQVACSVVAAVLWMMKNPDKGVCVPDDLPHDEILSFAKQYLGNFISGQIDWTPVKNRVDLFEGYNGFRPSEEDKWQFSSFLIQ